MFKFRTYITIMNQFKLLIKPDNEEVSELYLNHGTYNEGDSGLDLYVPEDIEIKCGEEVKINLKIKTEMKTNINNRNVSYYLYPRSSINKTPLILTNSVGIIDAGYRGNLIASVKFIPTNEILEQIKNNPNYEIPTYKIGKNTRLFQVCSPTLEPFEFEVVESLSTSQRGENGIGSTGSGFNNVTEI